MHVYGVGSVESICKSFTHAIFTSAVYIVVKKVRVAVHWQLHCRQWLKVPGFCHGI